MKGSLSIRLYIETQISLHYSSPLEWRYRLFHHTRASCATNCRIRAENQSDTFPKASTCDRPRHIQVTRDSTISTNLEPLRGRPHTISGASKASIEHEFKGNKHEPSLFLAAFFLSEESVCRRRRSAERNSNDPRIILYVTADYTNETILIAAS